MNKAEDVKALIEKLKVRTMYEPYNIEQLLMSYRGPGSPFKMGTNEFKIIDDGIDTFRLIKKPKKYSSQFEDRMKKEIEWIVIQLTRELGKPI